MASTEARTFGQVHFGAAPLGDRRRVGRLVRTADLLAAHPEGTFPDKLAQPADLKAFYRLVESPAVTHANVLAAHLAETHRRMAEHPGVVLIVHDTTVLDYSGLASLAKDLGPIGNGRGHGYHCHNSLAIAADTRWVLGLAGQTLHRRRRVARRETKRARRQHPDRESRLWKRASQGIPSAPANRLWVDVADRGADIKEFLDYQESVGKKYLVRSQHNRWVELRSPGNLGENRRVKLHDWARSLPAQSQRTLRVPAGPGRAARTATLATAFAPVELLPSRQPRGDERGQPLSAWVVRTWEVNRPSQGEPLEWILLTNVAVSNATEAEERVAWYRSRWVIEEYHKGMKTGCRIEGMQFTQRERLEPAIALVSVVALTLLQMRDVCRSPEARQCRASRMLPQAWIHVLSVWRHGEPRLDWNVHEFYFALARLGGHQNRKHDHPPGWLVLWRGWTKLQAMLEGAATMRQPNCG